MSDGPGTIIFEWQDGLHLVRHEESAESSTIDLVWTFYWFLLGCGHYPDNVVTAMEDVAEEQRAVGTLRLSDDVDSDPLDSGDQKS